MTGRYWCEAPAAIVLPVCTRCNGVATDLRQPTDNPENIGKRGK